MAFVDTQVRPQGEQIDAVTPRKLKLSEAIRIGAKLRPQCTGRYFKNGGSCALGAAYEAIGGKPFTEDEDWRTLQVAAELCLKKEFGELPGGIWLINDEGATREQVADWLATQGL